MNREVKFRVWDGETMYFPCDENDLFLKIGDGGYFQVEDHSPEHFKDTPTKNGNKDLAILNSLDSENLKLIEFTGFKDKNSKEIYEGDICKQINMIVEVKFRYGCFFFCGKEDNGLPQNSGAVDFHDTIKQYEKHGIKVKDQFIHIEVIGNIQENPELLTKAS